MTCRLCGGQLAQRLPRPGWLAYGRMPRALRGAVSAPQPRLVCRDCGVRDTDVHLIDEERRPEHP